MADTEKKRWAQARKAYLAGGLSQQEVAKRYGLSLWAVRRRAQSEGWTAARAEAAEKALKAMGDAAAEEVAGTAKRAVGMVDDVLDAIQAGLAEGDLIASGRDARDVMSALQMAADLTGIRRSQSLAEQRARIDRLRADAEARRAEHATEHSIHVVIEGPAEDYAG